MNTVSRFARQALNLSVSLTVAAAVSTALAAPLTVSETPLFVSSGTKPNVMLTISNSNSMDEDATGLAVGSAAANSRSEIARRVARNLVANYGGALNMGLTAFQQYTNGGDQVRNQSLHSSPYDVSFDPANYNAAWTGNRASTTKRFREPNASSPGEFIYFNVNLPFYAGGNQGNGFCYSLGADASPNVAHPDGFNNGENPVGNVGPWDSYRCYTVKTGPSDVVPPTTAQNAANGWGGANIYNGQFFPTDSDLGQGITDFGKFLTWRFVSPTWFSNGSPGNGYVHIPVGTVDTAQVNRFNTKLGTSQFVQNRPVDPAFPLQNAGLTPLEGTLYTLRDYFNGNLSDAARGGALPAPPNSCGKNFSVMLTNGLPSVTRLGVPSSNVATMLADASTAAGALNAAGVDNYVVGFALPYGVNPAQLDTIAASGGTGSSYYATDEASLTSELNRVFNDILIRSGAAGAVALNSGSVQTNSKVYQAKFNTGDWSGQLQAFPINSGTGTLGAAAWDAGAVINTQDWNTDRVILTYNPVTNAAVRFRWPVNPGAPTVTEISVAQVAALNTSPLGAPDGRGSQRLEFLRGSSANEGTTAASFRRRNVSRLGDIVNSSPVFVGKPSMNLLDGTYASFKASNAARTEMIYVGANDGMLHGLRASDGREMLAYVPSSIYSRLSGLTAQGFSHKYLVDGSPVVSDIKIGANWRTMLVGGLGGGGRGLFALDVTDPAQFDEASPGTTVKWEFSSDNDADLGLTYSQPTIIKLNDGSAGVVVGNGYNNTGTGRAMLFILNAGTGAVIRKIDTGVGTVGTPNGLSSPAVVDLDGNGTADYVYAGDLRGNVWKFDLSATASGSWSVAYGAPLFTARDSGAVAQPITSTPQVSRHPNGGVMVMFGTGQYIQAADVASSAVQSLYGIWDNGAVVASRANLQVQTVASQRTTSGVNYRVVSNTAMVWGVKKGWYLDLPASGERVIVDPILRFGRFIVPTTIPASDPCASGGYSWLMELDYLSGGRLNRAIFDENQDGIVNAADLGGPLYASGQQIDAIASSPAVVTGFGTDENKYLNESSGSIARVREAGDPLANRRSSWRQIQ